MKVFDELKSKLKGLELEDDKIDELVDFAKKEVPKEFIPKDKYNEKAEELEAVKNKLEDTNSTIEELKGNTEDLDEYKNKLDQLNQEYEEFKEQADNRVKKVKKKSLFEKSLIKNGADPDFVDLIMLENEDKLDKMQLNDDGDDIVGKDEYINKIKEKRNKAFLDESVNTNKPAEGDDAETDEDSMTPDEIIQKRLKERGVLE